MSSIPDLQNFSLCIGTKQTLRALEQDQVLFVYVATDADVSLIHQVTALAEKQHVEVRRAESMRALGRASGIDVGAAMVAVLRVQDSSL